MGNHHFGGIRWEACGGGDGGGEISLSEPPVLEEQQIPGKKEAGTIPRTSGE